MLKRFFSPDGIWKDNAIAVVRIMVGLFMIYHGIEIADKEKMAVYEQFFPDMTAGNAIIMAYIGKTLELISGILLVTGFLTRIAALTMTATMLFITFGLGEGRIFMEEQHPFMFVIFAFLFFFTGGGKWSLDRLFFKNTKTR